MRINSNGRVGIGTDSPGAKLHVSNGNDAASGEFVGLIIGGTNQNNARTASLIKDTTTYDLIYKNNNFSSAVGSHIFKNGPSEFARIDSNGNVGIGTTSPGSKLQASGEIRGGRSTLQYISLFGDASFNKLSAISNSGNPKPFLLAANSDSSYLALRTESANPITFQTNNTERMRITSGGNVGIGTTDIDGQLEVRSSGALGIISRSTSTQGTATNKAFKARNNSDTDTFSVSYNGLGYFADNLGIGETNPVYKLHLGDAGANEITAKLADGADANFILATANGSSTNSSGNEVSRFGIYYEGAVNDWNSYLQFIRGSGATTGSIAFVTSQQEAMRINASANVGIGTSSPVGPLHVQNNDNSPGGTIQVWGADTGTNLRNVSLLAPEIDDPAQPFTFYTNNAWNFRVDSTDALTINASGNVGIGITSPDCRLHVLDGLAGGQLLVASSDTNSAQKYGSFGTVHYTNSEQPAIGIAAQSASSANTVLIGGGLGEFNAATDIRFYTAANNITTTGTQHLAIKSDGSIRYNQDSTNTPGLGNTTTGLAIEHLSSGAAAFVSRSDSTPVFLNRNNDGAILQFNRSGTLEGYINITTTGVSLVSTSDYRLKENAVSIADGITRVKQLQPKRFNFIADPLTTVDGFMAHEVQSVVPEATFGEHDAVNAEDNPEYQGLDQSKLIPLLTAALQEAIAKIETLETKVAALEAGS